MEKIIIAGGTGFIGLSLAEHLADRGFEPILIARSKPKTSLKFAFQAWDAVSVGEWAQSLNNARAVVNLAGRSVDCIKSPDNCDVILRSRVEATQVIGKALRAIDNLPPVWIQMSTAHIYGDPPRQVCTEESSTGYGLAPFVGKAWEAALLESVLPGTREVRLRTSFVIGKDGGALASLTKIAKLGLGGTVGSGEQGMSWIHEYDMNEIIHQAIVDERFQGVYIASSPHPVSNRVFMKQLRKALGIPIGLPATEWMTKIGAKWLFKTDPELALYGRYVKPKRLLEEGFAFKYTHLEDALADLTQHKRLTYDR